MIWIQPYDVNMNFSKECGNLILLYFIFHSYNLTKIVV